MNGNTHIPSAIEDATSIGEKKGNHQPTAPTVIHYHRGERSQLKKGIRIEDTSNCIHGNE